MPVPATKSDSTPESLTRLTREDLAAVTTAHRRATVRTNLFGIIGVLSGLATGAALLMTREALGWSESLDPFFFAGGWAIAATAAALTWRKSRRTLAAYQFACPSCGVGLLKSDHPPAEVTRAELAMSTGRCPDCGAGIFATDDTTPDR